MASDADVLEYINQEQQQLYNYYILSKIDSNTYDPYSQKQSLYGKVDNNFNPIILKEDPTNLTSLGGETIVLDFVADAFQALIAHIEETKIKAGTRLPMNYSSGNSIKPSMINALNPQSGKYSSPRKLYDDLLDNLFEYFSTDFITFNNRHKTIKNFKDFVKAFTNFTLGDMFPEYFALSYSGFMGRQSVTIDNTGLVIRVQDDLDHELYDLYEKYKDDPTLPYFSNACRKHGFFIHRYSPSTIIADLSSPQMRKYMKERGSKIDGDIKTKMGETSEGGLGHRHTFAIDEKGNGQTIEAIGAPSHTHKIVAYEVKPVAAEPNTGLYVHAHELPEQSMFMKYYDRTCNMDIDNIKKQVLDMYNTFVEMYPFNQTYKLGAKNELIPSGHYRKTITMDKLRGLYPDDFWLKYYLRLRLKEEKITLSPESYKKVLKKAREAHVKDNIMMAASVVNAEIIKRLHY